MRIVAISDLHGNLDFTVPECDVLIIAGDLCPDRYGPVWAPRGSAERTAQQRNWLYMRFIPWFERQPCRFALMTWGNHDYLDRTDHITIDHPRILVDQMAFFPARTPGWQDDDPGDCDGGIYKAWLTPWSNEFCGWNWMKPHADLHEVYNQIPAGTDIIVSHQPPYGYGDRVPPDLLEGSRDVHQGSQELRYHIARVKPKIVICGHIHNGHGEYRLMDADLDGSTCDVKVYNVSLVDEAYRLVHAPTVIDL